jgi:tyrosyl-DNA phosphodiesterase 2
LKPTYAQVESFPGANSDIEESDDVEPVQPLGCRHYKRNVKLQCFTCGGWYTCRFCHDETEDHILPRKETRNMLCMLCGSAQPASDICANCGIRAAWYYCGICKLWNDDANKSIYHCADCGICRVGRGIGKDFIHCKASYGREIILASNTYVRYRPVVYVFLSQTKTRTNVSSVRAIAIVQSAANISFRHHNRSFL